MPTSTSSLASPPEPPAERVDDDLALVFDLAPVGLCIARDRVIHRCNRSFATMFGHAPDQLHGQSLQMLYPSTSEFEHIDGHRARLIRKFGAKSASEMIARVVGLG